MPSPLDHSYLKPPRTTLKGRYILLAIIAHILLFVALSLNFHWRSETPPPAQAELWTELADLPQPTPQPPDPAPQQTTPPVASTPAETTPPQPTEAEIALERTRRQEQERLERERLAQQARQAAEERTRQERERQAAEEQARQERERQAVEEQARQERERQAAEEQARQERERQAAAARERQRREAQERERLRQEQLARIQSMAGGNGNSTTGATGPVGGSGGASQAYIGRLSGIVRRNITYTGDTSNNPTTVVYVETDNNGHIKTVRITRSSGNTAWDEAVVRALWKTEQLPADTDGRRPSTTFNFTIRPQ